MLVSQNLSSREPESTLFTYLRLSTRETMFKFTDHLLYNECVQFNIGHKIKWTDQIHYFKHVTPSPDVFLLVQVANNTVVIGGNYWIIFCSKTCPSYVYNEFYTDSLKKHGVMFVKLVAREIVTKSLFQFLEHSNDQFTMVGWIQIPIFSHTGPMTFVNRTNRSEMPLTLGSLDPSRQSRPLDLKSELDSEGGAAYAVVEVYNNCCFCSISSAA